MKRTLGLVLLFLSVGLFAQNDTLNIQSISAITFDDQGRLILGDALAGRVYSIDINDNATTNFEESLVVANLELQVAALLGTSESNILIHDMAVNPVSRNVYFSVSRARAKWTSRWYLPNDLANAQVLVKVDNQAKFSLVNLNVTSYTALELPNAIQEGKHPWKKDVEFKVDAITDLDYKNGKLYISGLSNEEFAAAMWVADYPFKGAAVANSLEIYHGAHGAWETQAPIRAFLPYGLGEREMMLAAYLCTPLVTFDRKDLEKKSHVKGRTVAEFGSGNYPLDMISYSREGKDFILISNSQLPLMIVDPEDIDNYEGSITSEVKTYAEGVPFTARAATGVQELEPFNDKYILITQRLASGALALVSYDKRYLVK